MFIATPAEEFSIDLDFELKFAREIVLSRRGKLLALPTFSNVIGPHVLVLGTRESLEVSAIARC